MNLLLHPRTEAQLTTVTASRSGSYVFHGPAGIGKASAAREIARRLNCLGDEAGPCGPCKQFGAGSYPDLVTLAPEDKPSITVEQVRRLTSALSLRLYHPAGVRVIVIDDAHQLTTEAQNALLKILEEPPVQTSFILVTDRLESLLPTVRSRCAPIYFAPITTPDLDRWLQQTHQRKPSDAAQLATAAAGLPGRAISFTTTPAAAAASLEIDQVADSVPGLHVFDRLLVAKDLAAPGTDLPRFTRSLHRTFTTRLRDGRMTAPAAARALAATEHFSRQLQAKVTPRAALERLMLEF